MDMPMPTKALYFLLGMEADDEGFVSPKRVMRLYGGNEDDLQVLIAKKFVIQFKSGVIVITDWKENNYLDKNRIKETKYQAEKSLLALSRNKYYMLNDCLTNVKPEESRVEESRVEERRIISKTAVAVLDTSTNKKIGEIINAFKEVNPLYEKLFMRKAERDSSRWLLEKFGEEKIKNLIAYLPILNADKFAIKYHSYKPTEVERNIAGISAHAKRNMIEKTKPKITKMYEE